jgi:phosphonate transport system ATP-binding protein
MPQLHTASLVGATRLKNAACRATNLWFAYRPEQWVLRGISLEVASTGFLMVLGASGSGKTTLLKVLAGMLKPQTGTVELLSQTLNGHCAPELRQRIGYIPQQLGLVRGLTALENVLLGALGRMKGIGPLLGVYPKIEVELARHYLAFLGIEHKAHEKTYRLSGGERQRVAIARTLVQKPQMIFADEFVSDLDLPRATQVLEAMHELSQREHIAFIINLHEIPLAQALGEQILILKQGCVVLSGRACDVMLPTMHDLLAT